MRPLVRVRRQTPFDAARLTQSPLSWPIARALARLGPLRDFPDLVQLGRVFEGEAPVRFVPSMPRARREGLLDPASLYDARIVRERSVPTRARCWHDLANALVWGTFPRAKAALHARQQAAIAARIAPGARTLPPARTRELDALALLDEGGVAVLADDPASLAVALRTTPGGALREAAASGRARAVVFGHAIFESLALGVTPAIVAAVALPARPPGPDPLAEVDAGLAACLADPRALLYPRALCRVDLGEL